MAVMLISHFGHTSSVDRFSENFVTVFYHFLGGLEDTELKTGNFQSLTRKPSYSSFFSVLCPDLKNVFFEKIH